MTSSNRARESFMPYTVIPENGVIAFYFYFFPMNQTYSWTIPSDRQPVSLEKTYW